MATNKFCLQQTPQQGEKKQCLRKEAPIIEVSKP